MFDAVLSYHADPITCGVAKFNQRLAQELGVPHQQLNSGQSFAYPLLSIKNAEIVHALWWLQEYPTPYAVFWHDKGDPLITARATQVFYATDTGCPSALTGIASRPGKNVLTYGMADRVQTLQHHRLKVLLDALPDDYTVSVSAAVHEGHPWDSTTKKQSEAMRSIYGDHLRYLGFLADDALAREIRDAHMIALFYQGGARRNNTTLWAALEVGTPVITNLDADSPPELVHNRSVFDIHQLTEWPDAAHCREVRFGGWQAASTYSWPNLVAKLKAPVHA